MLEACCGSRSGCRSAASACCDASNQLVTPGRSFQLPNSSGFHERAPNFKQISWGSSKEAPTSIQIVWGSYAKASTSIQISWDLVRSLPNPYK